MLRFHLIQSFSVHNCDTKDEIEGQGQYRKKEKFLTIMRVFLIDTSSFKNAIQNIKDNEPDAVEIMPGIAFEIVKAFRAHISQPIILGGLIWEEEQVVSALSAGADSVSLSKEELWDLKA